MCVLYLYTGNMQRITTQFIYRIAPLFQNIQHNSTPEMNIKMQTRTLLWWNFKHYSLSINCDCLKCHWISEHDVIFRVVKECGIITDDGRFQNPNPLGTVSEGPERVSDGTLQDVGNWGIPWVCLSMYWQLGLESVWFWQLGLESAWFCSACSVISCVRRRVLCWRSIWSQTLLEADIGP